MERVEHHVTRLIPGYSKIDYTERLRLVVYLVFRYHLGAMIEIFKYLRNIYNSDSSNLLSLEPRGGPVTRGHCLKLRKQIRQHLEHIA